MTFKESLKNDIETFMNTDEFAEKHTVCGVDVKCTIDSDVLTQRSGGTVFGIDELDCILYIGTADLLKNGIERKGYGAHMEVDGRIYTVLSWTEVNGISTISLSIPQES